ncbi:amidase [Pelagibius litoralis]|uniref:Amidase n=1 Tax=Pelagibius litoralis TaxID=374515 RepID=A0A967EZU7_9PROT|nr:amidase [Pelagibius litoralis]NIA70433.1 amidase [Pelagibius litoralis]
MKLDEYVDYDATGLGKLVSAGEVTALELTRLAREAHDIVNPRINAIIEFYEDAETVAGADAGLFNGVPFLRKDLGGTEAGRLQEGGSRLFKGRRTKTDSYFYRRAREGGLRTLGRTTTPEFGISGFSESMLNGVTGNPWDLKLSAGGSSAGAAAAVAAGIVPIASGGDGGGSIRTPASWCGLVGLNPSRGRISSGPDRQDSNFGFSRNFVLCRSVRDMAAALDVFSGPFSGDPFIIVQPDRPYVEELKQSTGCLRVGVARTKWGDVDVEPETLAAVEASAKALAEMGHAVEDMDPPHAAADYSEILLGMADIRAGALEEAARAMGREINSDTLEPVNLKLYEHGKNLPLSHAGHVYEAVRKMRASVGEAIEAFDILLTPVMPVTALPHGGVYCATNDTFSAEEYMDADAALYQHLGVFNVTGHPSVSLPLAQSSNALPIGVQIVGRFGDEATLVRVARDLEEAMPWAGRRPPIHAGSG